MSGPRFWLVLGAIVLVTAACGSSKKASAPSARSVSSNAPTTESPPTSHPIQDGIVAALGPYATVNYAGSCSSNSFSTEVFGKAIDRGCVDSMVIHNGGRIYVWRFASRDDAHAAYAFLVRRINAQPKHELARPIPGFGMSFFLQNTHVQEVSQVECMATVALGATVIFVDETVDNFFTAQDLLCTDTVPNDIGKILRTLTGNAQSA